MKKRILAVEDDKDIQIIYEAYLSNDYTLEIAGNGSEGLAKVHSFNPDIILLDVMMPGMSGYDFCAELKSKNLLSTYPVIFATALSEEKDKAKAFALGAVDYLVKPFNKEILFKTIEKNINTKERWLLLENAPAAGKETINHNTSAQFADFLMRKLRLPPEKTKDLLTADLDSTAKNLEILPELAAQYAAEFTNMKYIPFLDPESIVLGVVSNSFSIKNKVIVSENDEGKNVFVISNPMDRELIDILKGIADYECVVTEQENITQIYGDTGTIASFEEDKKSDDGDTSVKIANLLILKAARLGASDIHFEPKEFETLVRFRVDGDMQPPLKLKNRTGVMVISRYKVLADLDIAERRKPQDGAFQFMIHGKKYKLRVATTTTPFGESMVIRLLEPDIKPKPLGKLGFNEAQENTLKEFAQQSTGLVLIVGQTGSGKTTTIYSLINNIDCKTRSLISVEDPVEYTIADANQQQINEKAGITFEKLLKSSMRQDPDVFFIGEIRDTYSANIAIEAASSGHLIITSLHTSNATTAIMRMEMLGISRKMMSDALLGVTAQKLLKVLCPNCREVAPISEEEKAILSRFTSNIPESAAHSAGCAKCNNTGYIRREGVYEVLKIDPTIAHMIREGEPINKIRLFCKSRGDFLISDHAIEKIRAFKISVKDAYENVLLEEVSLTPAEALQSAVQQPSALLHDKSAGSTLSSTGSYGKQILLVEDDIEIQTYTRRILENRGYSVSSANDGIEALMLLGKIRFNLILSDINMPNMDGLKLLEMKMQKGVDTPVIFLTAQTGSDMENTALKLGATDYIKKPFDKDTLLLRIQRTIK